MRRRGAASRALTAAGLALLVAAAAALALLAEPYVAGRDGRDFARFEDASAAEDGFPDIDWDALMAENPDTVGWVKVEGTPIDYPIVRASEGDPQRYLSHDFYGNENVYGCPYLASGCASLLEGSAIVYGHNMLDGSMFSSFEKYLDQGFFDEHREVLVMTPERNARMRAVAARAVSAYDEGPAIGIEGRQEVGRYLRDAYSRADAAGDPPQPAAGVVTFVCCSASRENGRALVYAVESGPSSDPLSAP